MTHADQANAPASIDELLEVDPSSITTIIDEGVHFEGKLSIKGSKTVLISGAFTGQIESEGAVIINGGAEVVGGIKARSVQVAGTVRRGKQGDVLDVQGVLVLAKGARVQCDAVYGDLKAEYGVHIAGGIRPREMAAEEAGEAGAQRPDATVVAMPGLSIAN